MVGRRWWAKNVAMPGGVRSIPDGMPTKYGTEILRACAVALTREMVAEVGPTRVIGRSAGPPKDVVHAWGGGVATVG